MTQAPVSDVPSVMYPHITPYETGMLPVDDTHTIYYEQSGNPEGTPVVFVHGGPGGGTNPKQRRYFDPEKYRIILFDQRGCGKSTPFAELTDNTTAHLIADMEKLREHVGAQMWHVFGGSWGSTLALAYAQAHPDHVSALILRGIFLGRQQELDWFFGGGAAGFFPDIYQAYRDFIPKEERGDIIGAYYKRLTGDDDELKLEAARRWTLWESATSSLRPVSKQKLAEDSEPTFALPFARIECHYFKNNIFIPEGALLFDENIAKIAHIPTAIVQGRYDMVCPPISAWQLHEKLPESELIWVSDAGHSSFEENTAKALVAVCDSWADGAA